MEKTRLLSEGTFSSIKSKRQFKKISQDLVQIFALVLFYFDSGLG
jgi:hypothetical protein